MAIANPTTQKHLEFAARLGAALDHLQITGPNERVKIVAEAGVTPRTAKKYLAGESRPVGARGITFIRKLCGSLKVTPAWLEFAEGAMTTKEEQVINNPTACAARAKVIPFPNGRHHAVNPFASQATMETLENLLVAARKGEIVGMAYVTFKKKGAFSIGITGDALDDPVRVLGQLAMLQNELIKMANDF